MRICLLLITLSLCLPRAVSASLPAFDFTETSAAKEWGQAHDVVLEPTGEGLRAGITGPDPYFSGPARDYPAGENLWINLRLKSEQAGMAQLFFFQHGATEEKSVRFHVPTGDWAELRVALPPLGPNTRLRLDPPGTSGVCLFQKVSFELRPQLRPPQWHAPVALPLDGEVASLRSGPLTLRHGKTAFGRFELLLDGKRFAIGHAQPDIGYASGDRMVWLQLMNSAEVSARPDELRISARLRDAEGAEWKFERVFRNGKRAGTIDVETQVNTSADRDIVFLPMFTLFPGIGSFGTNKTQGLLAGIEYLENEPSSSEADVIGPGALRRVPDSLKLTFPLMAIAAENHWLALSWEEKADFAGMFDSPDRIFGSGGHVLGVIYPGSAPQVREDGNVLPYGGVKLKGGTTLTLHATISGGVGASVIPAVQQYVRVKGFPKRPEPGLTDTEYYRLAASGWLESSIRDGARYRHAVGGTFGSHPAADAAMTMSWLACKVRAGELAGRLKSAAAEALELVPPQYLNSMAVGHVRSPAQALVFGSVALNAETAAAEARNTLRHFEADGSVIFKAPANGADLGRTHFSREANGLAATYVSSVLERACFAGDRALIEEGLRLLRALNKFTNTVPRGAQTWEVPLHTPDILASGYLVRAYTLGYELTGEAQFLEQASYWAWTGIPFLYLRPPVDKPVGVYSTIPVLGATQWVAPLWIGLPVQWCGLVYGNAIRRLARHDTSASWYDIADGIAVSGVQQTHPRSDEGIQGLLPDSFELRHQVRNPVPINPATLLVEALAAYGEETLYDFHCFRRQGLLLHAPGPILDPEEKEDSIAFSVVPWSPNESFLLINGVKGTPRVRADGKELEASRQDFDPATERLVLKVRNKCRITVELKK